MTQSKFFRISVVIIISIVFSSCKLGRFVVYKFVDIKDYKKFPSRPLTTSENKFKFKSTPKGIYPDTLKLGGKAVAFDKLLEDNKTVAFSIKTIRFNMKNILKNIIKKVLFLRFL